MSPGKRRCSRMISGNHLGAVRGGRQVSAGVLLVAIVILLTSCGGGGGGGAGGAGTGTGTISVSGSGGDGPVVGGLITVTDANGNSVSTTPTSPVTDATAHYSFSIPSATPLPITVTLTGGTDQVTGKAPDFALAAAATGMPSSGSIVLNLSPLSTLALESAKAEGGGAVTAARLDAAKTNLLNTLGFGLATGIDPVTTRVTTANVASVLRANEAAAELIRRVKQSAGLSFTNTITAIAEDITDGKVDGNVKTGVTVSQANSKVAAMILAKQAKISAELVADKLDITDGAGATLVAGTGFVTKMNAALLKTQPSATGSNADISQLAPTQAFLDQAKRALAGAGTLAGAGGSALDTLRRKFGALKAGSVPTVSEKSAIATDMGTAATAFTSADANAGTGTNVASALSTAASADVAAPVLTSFTSTTTNGSYRAGDTIDITATYDEAVASGSTLTVSLNSGKTGLVLNTISGNTITGTYTVGAGETSADLTVSAITSQSVSDAAGNTQGGTTLPSTNIAAGSAIVVDTTAPTQTFSALAFSADTGVSSSDFITKTAAQTITATLSAAPGTGEKVLGSLDNGASWTDITASVTNKALSWGVTLLNGAQTLKLKVQDAAGNDGPVASQAYTLDTTAPAQTFSALAFSADTGASASDFITKTAAQTITATLSAAPGAGENVLGSLDNGASWTDITASVTNKALSWGGVTLAGSNTLKLKVQDAAGNDGPVASQAYTLDTTAPTVTTHHPASNATAVTLGAAVDATFSEPVVNVSTSTFTITPQGGAALSGTTVNHNAGNNESLSHADLAPFTTYTVALANAITDVAGNALAATNWSFTTMHTWSQEAYIKAINANPGDVFGTAVSLDAANNLLAVGATGEDSSQITITKGAGASTDNSFAGAGAVDVYRRSGTNWAQEAYIKAANADANDGFGASVAASGDTTNGDTLAVGATGEASNQTTITNGASAAADNAATDAGAVYVYRRSGTNWAQEAYIKATNAEAGDNFGQAVSLDAANNLLAVGAPLEDSSVTTITNGASAAADNAATDAGAVYVYRRSGTNWAQEAYIKAANAEAGDNFGQAVSLDAANNLLAVGAPLEDSSQTTITNGATASADNAATDAGAVYVYRRSGTNWAQEAYIKAANAGAGDNLGRAAMIGVDTLVTGAPLEDSNVTSITNGASIGTDNNSAADAGAVYVYKYR